MEQQLPSLSSTLVQLLEFKQECFNNVKAWETEKHISALKHTIHLCFGPRNDCICLKEWELLFWCLCLMLFAFCFICLCDSVATLSTTSLKPKTKQSSFPQEFEILLLFSYTESCGTEAVENQPNNQQHTYTQTIPNPHTKQKP